MQCYAIVRRKNAIKACQNDEVAGLVHGVVVPLKTIGV